RPRRHPRGRSAAPGTPPPRRPPACSRRPRPLRRGPPPLRSRSRPPSRGGSAPPTAVTRARPPSTGDRKTTGRRCRNRATSGHGAESLIDFGGVPLLEVRDLSVRFGGVVALDRVSFGVDQGQVVALIGPNGAGKTTLFNVITRVYRPSTGTVLIDGRSVLSIRPHQVIRHGLAR